jgi:hypothetical protein
MSPVEVTTGGVRRPAREWWGVGMEFPSVALDGPERPPKAEMKVVS